MSLCSRIICGLTLAVVLPLFTTAARAQTTTTPATALDVYLSGPRDTSVPYNDTTVETFESLPTGKRASDYASAIGTYRLSGASAFSIQNDDQYGAGSGKYMAFGAQSGTSGAVTLDLTSPASYFGFSWNAGDRLNGISFFSGTMLVGRYGTSNTLAMLGTKEVTSIDGTVYQSANYFGKPSGASAGSNTNESYGFLSFIARGGTFDRIVFDNSGSTGSGFESDNHTVRASAPVAKGSFVRVGTTQVPEPGTLALLLPVIGLVACRRKH